MRNIVVSACVLIGLGGVVPCQAQNVDILLKGGHVIDPRNGVDQVLDVAIAAGVIAAVGADMSPDSVGTVVDASGMYVTPGLIDMHVHVFWGTESNAYLSNSYSALPPDGFTFRAGVTTVVDVGGAGWRNIRQFEEQTIAHSKTRVLAFLNIVGSGMKGGPVEQDLNDMDPKLTAMAAQRSDHVVGVKLAHYRGHDWEPVVRAVEAGRQADIPVMIDFGGAESPLPLAELLLDHLRPGDILTHTYANVRRREAVADDGGKVRASVFEAQKKGVVFDVGHGGGSFLFSQAVPATQQGFWPNSISTDLHTGSMNRGMKDMANVMSKFLNLGMSLQDVIERSTWNPARYIKREDLGHLEVGAVADVAVFSVRRGEFGFLDVRGGRLSGNQKLETELTIREGKIVWDLNGISRPLWNSDSDDH